jgi:hypothetical protein
VTAVVLRDTSYACEKARSEALRKRTRPDAGEIDASPQSLAARSETRLHRSARYKNADVHVSVTRTRTAPDRPIEIATIAGEEMLRWLQDIDGFEGLLMLSNEAEGTTLALTFWESREVADRHRAARMQFRDRVTATVNVQVEETVDYEVTFAHFGSGMAAETRK